MIEYTEKDISTKEGCAKVVQDLMGGCPQSVLDIFEQAFQDMHGEKNDKRN